MLDEIIMTANRNNLEIEIKFYIEDPKMIRKRLVALGAAPHDNVFETNLRYENRDRSLLTEGKLLRLRKDNGCRLTYKDLPKVQDGAFKIHREIEVDVGDFETMGHLLEALGFQPCQIYEKWRQTFTLGQTLVCLDTLPFGDFLEIEGSKQGICKAVEQLALPWEKRITKNYLSIFELLRDSENLPFNDVTFAHFKVHPVHVRPYLNHLYADNAKNSSR